MDLDEALSQITEIRSHLARTSLYRGFRALPVACSGLMALATAWVQSQLVDSPRDQLDLYLALWLGSALLCASGAGVVMARRAQRPAYAWDRRMTWAALEQLMPALVAGAMLTVVLVRSVPSAVSLLPGLWQVLFSLGIFASCRLLPRPIFWVGVFYLFTGLGCLAWFPGDASLAPWVMGLPFGFGQLMAASILYWTLERPDDHSDSEG